MHLKNAYLLTFKHLYILSQGERHPLFFYCKVDLKNSNKEVKKKKKTRLENLNLSNLQRPRSFSYWTN